MTDIEKAFDDFLEAFEEFRQANDDRLAAIEKRLDGADWAPNIGEPEEEPGIRYPGIYDQSGMHPNPCAVSNSGTSDIWVDGLRLSPGDKIIVKPGAYSIESTAPEPVPEDTPEPQETLADVRHDFFNDLKGGFSIGDAEDMERSFTRRIIAAHEREKAGAGK